MSEEQLTKTEAENKLESKIVFVRAIGWDSINLIVDGKWIKIEVSWRNDE